LDLAIAFVRSTNNAYENILIPNIDSKFPVWLPSLLRLKFTILSSCLLWCNVCNFRTTSFIQICRWNSPLIPSSLTIVDQRSSSWFVYFFLSIKLNASPGCSRLYRLAVAFFPDKFQSTFHLNFTGILSVSTHHDWLVFFWIPSFRFGLNCLAFNPSHLSLQLAILLSFFGTLSFDRMLSKLSTTANCFNQ
jgi:hypothetical protein